MRDMSKFPMGNTECGRDWIIIPMPFCHFAVHVTRIKQNIYSHLITGDWPCTALTD